MPVPDYQSLMLPILKLISTGHATIPSCLDPLAQKFKLSTEETTKLLPSRKQTVLANRAHWARNYMSQAGLVEPVKRGHYILTSDGQKVLDNTPNQIDAVFLKKFPKFQEFLERSKPKDKHASKNGIGFSDQASIASSTPIERVEAAVSEINSALAGEVIEAVLSLSPLRFEKLVVDLLLAMGYGGGELERGLQTSLSGDGGIDGIINEDKLGLDAVYVQAKRYAPDNKVGRPALNAFVGSLTGEGASKGVFVTTSDFSKDATEYVDRVQHRIVLINGNRLARLMIEHEVGVRARNTFVLRSVDEDYFSED